MNRSLPKFLPVLLVLSFCSAFAQDEPPQLPSGADGLAASGSSSTFNYWRSSPTSEYYVVQSAVSTGFTFMVSDNFLGLVLRSAPVDDKTRLSMLAQYPFFMNALYTDRMNTNYPAADRSYDKPFETVEADGLSIVQDDMASPYVRVRVVNPDGTIEEFSVNRDLVDRILAEQDWETTNLVGALRSYPYRLPENARANFRYLTKAQIIEMAESVPGVAKQEFVKTRRLYLQPHLAPAMSNAAVVAAENTPAEPFAPPAPKAARETAVAAAKVGADSESPAEPAKSPSNESGRGRWVALGAILLACVGVAFALGRRSGQR